MTTTVEKPLIEGAPVNGSSTIAYVEWFESTATLRVRFLSGGTYRFSIASMEIARRLINAESAGKYFAAHIKGKYPSVKEASA